jgi:hypothetical protein
LYVPFFEKLFGTGADLMMQEDRSWKGDIAVEVSFQDSVQWGRRGSKRPTNDPVYLEPILDLNKSNQTKKVKLSTVKESADSDSESESENDECCYIPLTTKHTEKYA